MWADANRAGLRLLPCEPIGGHPRYIVSTVGRDEEVIRNYIRHQESEDQRIDQLGLLR